MRKSDAKGVFVQVDQKDGKAKVTLDAVNLIGKYVNGAETEVTVIEPQGGEKKVPLVQSAPGRYAGEFDAAKAGTYHLNLTQKNGATVTNQQSRGLVVNYDDELRIRPTDEKLLESVAQVSGGKYKPTPAEVFAEDERTANRAVPIWPYLVIAAALLFLLDVALRRIDFDLLLGRPKPAMKMVMRTGR
jgi:hypothetical protein